MADERPPHRLTGCAPTPLAHYLKALGILRLVAEQADSGAQGWWAGDVFHLRTKLSCDDLRSFFLRDYRPTPIIAPWNGGSGFFPKDNRAAVDALSSSNADRFASYRQTIAAARRVLSTLGLSEKPDGDTKASVLIGCRGQLSDEAVASLDAAYVLTDDGPKYPPLLGTGLNDGRLEFTNNFMQRLLDIIDSVTGEPARDSSHWWDEAFFPQPHDGLQRDSILGQFDPGAVDRPVNPWDFVLMLEGALVFSAAAVKRLASSEKGILSYPFCVRPAGVGYGSAASSDEDSCRAEMWLPLWRHPGTYHEIQSLFTEGRAQVHQRAAKSGVDFARAVSTLGTDRGIDEFARVGFHARNGLAYFAVPLGRFQVEPDPKVNLLAEPKLDAWLDSFRRAASSDNAPSRAQRALRQLETAILDLCQLKGLRRLQAVLIALGEAEAVLAIAPKWREEAYQRPVPLLPPQWLTDTYDGSPEFRLAASLAGLHSPVVGALRQYLEPVAVNGAIGVGRSRWVEWTEDSAAACNVVWNAGSLEHNLIAVLQRRAIEAVRKGSRADDGLTLVFPGESDPHAPLSDVAAFLAGETDDELLAGLIRGLTLIDWAAVRQAGTCDDFRREPMVEAPDAAYALLKLCHTPYRVRETFVRFEPTITQLACAGRLGDATRLAARRLLGSSLPPAVKVAGAKSAARRIAAALIFPLAKPDTDALARGVLKLESVPL